MTSEADRRAILDVRTIFDRTAAAGWRPESVAPATDEQIDRWAASQGCDALPASVREIMRLLGSNPGIWLRGSLFGITRVGAASKKSATAARPGQNVELADSAGMLVLVEHQAYLYNVIDGNDLHDPNPPVWIVDGDNPAEIGWGSVTDWFASAAPSMSEYRSRARLLHRIGKDIPTWWGKHFDIDRLNSPE
ncbi:hypothetical protein ACWDOP_12340 [Nocardia sp. NPDC003693]